MDWGKALYGARRRKRMSQEHLAAAAGVSVRTIRRAERGEGISDESLRCLCAILELQADVEAEGTAETIDAVIDERPVHEVFQPAFNGVQARALNAMGLFPAVTAAVAALLVLTGAWPQAGVPAIGLLCVQVAVACAGPAIARRLDAASTAIALGFAPVFASVQWLINFGAESPKALQAVMLAQMLVGIAMMAMGIMARHREWRDEAAYPSSEER